MKQTIKLNNQELANGLSVIKQLKDTNYNNLRIKPTNNQLIFTYKYQKGFFNTFLQFSQDTLDTITDDKTILTHFKLFESLLNNKKGDVTEIELTDNSLISKVIDSTTNEVISSGNVEIEYDEPIINFDFDDSEKITLNVKQLVEALERIKHALDKKGEIPVIGHVNCEIEGSYLKLSAIDGFRVAQVKIPILLMNKSNIKSFMIDRLSVDCIIRSLKRLLKKNKDLECEIRIKRSNPETYVSISVDNFRIISEYSSNSKFVELDGVFLDKVDTSVTIDTKVLKDALKEIYQVIRSGDKENNLVKFIISKDSLNLSTITKYNNIEVNLNGVKKGKDLTIAFNCKYLLDAITHVKDKEITLEFKTEVSPLMIRNYLDNFIVLPVRLRDNI